jgi:hypothetical protein
MLRIHTRLHIKPLATLSRMTQCYPKGPVSKGPQMALEWPMRETLDAMQEVCQISCQYPFGDMYHWRNSGKKATLYRSDVVKKRRCADTTPLYPGIATKSSR